ncbi:hypothetical protein Poli38472_009213 [Pythium oligandrum]|uniref:PPIase cyclophilin-type domain-containing protein n=1 Tax=Pythium oligandrum TaxID=41045 RepID=A0A8K1CK15_PYTOL|nr:hypothetical protein Poli38472_009213 [Pythium oligandrum]|eukprot:TMW65046.1 hypothetical protein Poli38472_009213 [Pythium oligandrum]
MSNIYITEPGTEGKVLLHTSFGDLDVELWPQQAPKACRNFVQLCLEGYYDNTIFHRIISGFMVQGGDPTGTGNGGESIYGEAFVDEFHTRLKFNHRGILAMANENKPNSNHSQFFFTLDACEFLNQKHTIFGKITGNTIFNLLSVGELETDGRDRPLNPPKVLSAEVLWNPFDDIVPRDLKPRKAEEDAAARKKKERKATKDMKLLSFGDEEEAFQEELVANKRKKQKKMMSSHDLLDDKKLKADVDQELVQKISETVEEAAKSSEETKKKDARSSLKAVVAAAAARKAADGESNAPTSVVDTNDEVNKDDDGTDETRKKKRKADTKDARDEYTKLREELKKSKKAAVFLIGDKAREQDSAKAFHDMLTPLQQQRQKFLERKKAANRSGRQQDTLQRLEQFKAKLQTVAQTSEPIQEDTVARGKSESYHGQVLEDDEDNDQDEKDHSWMAAKLKFKKHIDDQFRNHTGPTTDDYLTIDTRDEKHRTGGSRRGEERRRHRSRSAERGHSRRSRSRSRDTTHRRR